jgi:hypothetical protein
MAASIRAEVNSGMFATVAARLGRADRERLERLLLVDPVRRRSKFDRLKDPAQAATVSKLKKRLAHLAALDALGPTEVWLAGVPPGEITHFAGEARVTDAADMRKVLADDKRLTLLICLVHEYRTAARDDVVTMFCKRMAALHKKGRDWLEELRERHRAESERLLGVFGAVLAAAREATTPTDADPGGDGSAGAAEDVREVPGAGADVEVAERAGRLVLKALDDAGGLEELTTAHEAVSAYQGAPVPEIAAKLVIKTGKNAGKHPSAASVYRALADDAATAAEAAA